MPNGKWTGSGNKKLMLYQKLKFNRKEPLLEKAINHKVLKYNVITLYYFASSLRIFAVKYFRASLNKIYFTPIKNRFHLIFDKKFLSLSSDNQIKEAFPTM